ncbi:hypothetical protein K2Q00_01470 [Patescibacteria group bacterium]|nr:hypothetical protein [Patescibacteria group bacterium]
MKKLINWTALWLVLALIIAASGVRLPQYGNTTLACLICAAMVVGFLFTVKLCVNELRTIWKNANN